MMRNVSNRFWKGKKVFITGHTGFKGSWLSFWLHEMGASITGYSLNPPTNPNLFELLNLKSKIKSVHGDVRDLNSIKKHIKEVEIVFHMAAQPLVRRSYKDPVETFSVNVMGTVNLLESVRSCPSIRAVINVTTDKIYENKEKTNGYKENEPLGGYDPYSSSKACSELVTSAYRSSFLNDGVAVATARAGNVIGGGDWGVDRLVPDFIKAILEDEKILIRNPKAIRPWQYVLDPLNGYLMLARKLYESGQKYAEAWNFGPAQKDAKTVEWLVRTLCSKWGKDASYAIDKKEHPHETQLLTLDSSKAKAGLKWSPKMEINSAIDNIIEWTRAYKGNKDLRDVCFKQIKEFVKS